MKAKREWKVLFLSLSLLTSDKLIRPLEAEIEVVKWVETEDVR